MKSLKPIPGVVLIDDPATLQIGDTISATATVRELIELSANLRAVAAAHRRSEPMTITTEMGRFYVRSRLQSGEGIVIHIADSYCMAATRSIDPDQCDKLADAILEVVGVPVS